MNRFIIFPLSMLAMAAAATAVGCQQGEPLSTLPPPLKNGQPMMPVDTHTKLEKKRYTLIIRLRMITIEVPLGTVSDSEELWSYLDEEPVQAAYAAALGRNGVRIGAGRFEAWADIAKIFTRLTGRKVKERSLLTLPADPFSIILKPRQGSKTIFTSNEDDTLSGADYPPGDYLMAFSFTLDEDDPSRVIASAVPQVRSTQHKPTLVNSPAGPMIVHKPSLYPFRSMQFQLALESKDFIVIGPGIESRRKSSVGHHFFVKTNEGVEFETVFVVLPEVFAAEIHRNDRPQE